MNAKYLFTLCILFALLLTACSPRVVTQAPAATEALMEVPVEVVRTVEVQMLAIEAPPEPRFQPQQPIAVQPQVIQPEPTQPDLPPPGLVPLPIDNFFRDYGLNPFEDTLEDHYSTFGLDVDTASYSVARSYVMDGNLPPAEAVRLEEFVNYFDQGYASPQGVAFAVYADGAPSPLHKDGTYLLRIGVQGYQVPESARKPVSLTFVIDTSGSMEHDGRLELVKAALTLLVDELGPQDSVAIIAYNTQASLLLPSTSVADRQLILRQIKRLRPSGSTNADAGLTLGYQTAMQAFLPGGTNRVILCSDGVANTGDTTSEAILAKVRGYVEEGITLTTIGVGMGNFNDILLERLADDGNGFYAYVDDIDEARKVFVEDLVSTLEVIARDAKVQVDFNPDVVAYYRLLGYENRAVADQDFRNDAVDAGELGAGHSATALYAIYLRPQADGRIATVQLRWEDPESYQITEINGNINTWDLEDYFYDTDPHYQLAVLVSYYAEMLRESPWVNDFSLYQIHRLVETVATQLSDDPDVAEFHFLVERASEMHW